MWRCVRLSAGWLQQRSGASCGLASDPFTSSGVMTRCVVAINTKALQYYSSSSGLPSQAEIVICGGGVIGCSVAYHLAKLGKKDVVLLEQGSLSGGSTWHAAGLVSKLRATFAETMFNDYSAKLYNTIKSEAGVDAGFNQCGGLLVARTKDRLVAVKRLLDKARAFGLECELISPEDAKKMWPLMYADDLKGALWLPEEGAASPTDVCQALAKAAIKNGVRMYEKVVLEAVQTSGRAVQGVITNRGDIRCNVFVNCGGQWAREIGQKSEPPVAVPLYSSEHFYIVTKPIEGVHNMLPILRDPDGYVCFRALGNCIGTGGFEPVSKPCFHDGIPKNFEFQLLPEDWEHFEILMEQIVHRVPIMAKAEIWQMINGPESFTPDTRYILGEAPEIRNYFVAAGMNSTGIGAAGGVGKAVAEWIVEGEPTMDLWTVDIRRFGAGQNGKWYLRDCTRESLGWLYKLPYPCMERTTGRNLKCSPLYPQLEAAGASFGQKHGWERANWFAEPGEDRINHVSFGRQNWFSNVKREYDACYQAVGISDMTSLGLFQLKSKDGVAAKDFLQLLCVSNVDIPVGHTINTAMLNNKGGYQTECTLLRTADSEFIIIVPTEFSTRAHSWITRHLPHTDFVTLRSLQSSYTILGVFGPRSQEFLQGLTLTPLDTTCYPSGFYKTIHLAYASGVKMIRGTKIGHSEMSWLILVPTEHSVSLYDALMEAGKTFGIRNVGSYALECLRIEMGTPLAGYELTSHVTPYEAGMESTIDYAKSFKFVGMPALILCKDKPLTKCLVHATVEQHSNDNLPWGGEPIVRKDDVIGTVTSASYSFNHDKPICLGYVESQGDPIDSFFFNFYQDNLFHIVIAGQRYPLNFLK